MNIKWKYLSLIVPGTYVAVSSLHWSDNQTTRIHSGIPTSVYPPGLQGLQYYEFGSVQFSRSVVSDSLQPHELQHARPPCPSPTPGVHPDPCPLSWWCHPAISSSIVPFSCLQSSPASGSFLRSQFFTSGWISLQSKGLSRVFSNTTVQRHQFFMFSFIYSPTLTTIHDYWKNHSFD